MGEKGSKDGVFTRRDVIRIRTEIRENKTPTSVFAREFNVTPECIYYLATGYTHQDVNDEAPPVKEMSNLTEKAIYHRARVKELLEEGFSQADIARHLKLSQTYISLIAKGKR